MFITVMADKLFKMCPLICNYPWYETWRMSENKTSSNHKRTQFAGILHAWSSHQPLFNDDCSIEWLQNNDNICVWTGTRSPGEKKNDMWSIKPVSLEPFPSDFTSQLLNQWRDTMMLCYRGTCCFVQSSLQWSGFIQTSLPGCLLGYWTLPSEPSTSETGAFSQHCCRSSH